ncbi:hypothetical protein SDC9_153073 [bioreactor metagenome]|uniref:Uncharacterized protein n=1 Tax=bioreactor metagenome TaxID=1076179 RepID=A0A645EXB2_9ZZZZ
MLRGHPGVHADLGHKLPQLPVAHSVDGGAVHRLGPLGEDTNFFGDGGGGDAVVPGDHHRADSGGDALRHRRGGFLAGRVHHGNQPQKVQPVFIR